MNAETLARQIETLPSEYVVLLQQLVDALGGKKTEQSYKIDIPVKEEQCKRGQPLEWMLETWDTQDPSPWTREELHER